MKHTIHLIKCNALGFALFLDDSLVDSVGNKNDGLKLEESAVNLARALDSEVQFIDYPSEKVVESPERPTWQDIFQALRDEGRIRPGGQMPNSALPYQLNINVSGDTEDDLVTAVNEISSKLDDGYTSGFDSNDSGAYAFDLNHKPALKPTPLKS